MFDFDSMSAIENFFASQESDAICVGDPNALEKFYKRIREDYSVEEMQDILDCDENMLIVSCAGSGKTTTLILKLIRDFLKGKFTHTKIVNGIEMPYTSQILVTTFLKTGATELKKSMNEMIKKYNIKGIDMNAISFRTMHAEVYQSLLYMNYQPNIVDESDTYKYIRKACKNYNIHSQMAGKNKELTNDEVKDIACILTYARNRLDNSKYDHPLMSEYNIGEIELKAILEDFKMYKKLERVEDFEDLEEMLYDACGKYPNVLNYISGKYEYVYLDEFQDTSQLQYAILQPYLKNAKGFIAVGDDDQCFPCNFKVLTTFEDFEKIESVKKLHNVLTFVGDENVMQRTVDNTSQKYVDTDLVEIKTKSGKVITGTKEHIVFTKLPPLQDVNTVYLMYREEFGFRIGQTSGTRQGGKGEKRVGIAQRLNKEKGDKVWILRECPTKEEAVKWENYYSEKYDIPKYMFKIEKQYGLKKTQEDVFEMFNSLETRRNGMILLADFGYDFDYPHFIPKVRNDKCALYFTMFGGFSYGANGVKRSVITVDTTDERYTDVMRNHMSVSEKHPKNRKPYWCAKKESVSVDVLEEVLRDIVGDCKDNGLSLIVRKRIKVGKETYDFMPLSNVVKGMLVPIIENGKITQDEIIEVSKKPYKGFVYDISVPETRVFFGESTLVHNCIYSWRGSDVDLIQNRIAADYNPTIRKLTINRRCSENILKPIIPSIEKNTGRHKKNLRASKKGGKVEIVVDGGASYLMKSIREDLMRSEKVGILGRTNNDLLIPALLLELDGYSSFSLSNSVSLKDRAPAFVLGVMDLLCQRYNENFEGYFKMFVGKYNSFEATKLADMLSRNTDYNLYNIDLRDLEYSAPSLFSIIRMLRQTCKYNPETHKFEGDRVKAYLNLLDIIEQDVYSSKSIYAQRARDFTFYMRKIIKEHERVKDLTFDELYQLFTKDIAESLEKKKAQANRRVKKADGSWGYEAMIEDKSFVRITTVHDAKGKQWDNVYIWNDVDGCFPNSVGGRTLTKEEYEEERRVHYIAWTRAVKKLTVFTRSDRLDGFLTECDLSDATIIDVGETKRLTRKTMDKTADELVKGESKEVKPEVKKDWVWYVKEYCKKYTSYSYICTPKGSNLDLCLIHFDGVDNLVKKLEEYHLESYPVSDLELVISDILEQLANMN